MLRSPRSRVHRWSHRRVDEDMVTAMEDRLAVPICPARSLTIRPTDTTTGADVIPIHQHTLNAETRDTERDVIETIGMQGMLIHRHRLLLVQVPATSHRIHRHLHLRTAMITDVDGKQSKQSKQSNESDCSSPKARLIRLACASVQVKKIACRCPDSFQVRFEARFEARFEDRSKADWAQVGEYKGESRCVSSGSSRPPSQQLID